LLAAAAHPRAKRERNREKAWSMLQENTKKGKKTKALAARAFDRKSGTPGWIRTSGLPLRSMAYHVIHGSDVTSNIIPYAE
jgi:hypothetical protein